jgi:hypothetical protein
VSERNTALGPRQWWIGDWDWGCGGRWEFDLVFDGRAFPVPQNSLVELFDGHQELFKANSYTVRSSVPADVFAAFVASLTTENKLSITNGNAVPLWFLANECFLSDLAAECATFSISVDQFCGLSDRVSELERRMSFLSNCQPLVEEKIWSQEREQENVRLTLETLQTWADGQRHELQTVGLALEQLQTSVEGELQTLKGRLEQPPAQPRPPPSPPERVYPAPPPALARSLPPRAELGRPRNRVEISLPKSKSLEGIIAHLSKELGGNVQEMGIITITAKSVRDDPKYALKNVADLKSNAPFYSSDEPGQWVCWDFHEMRVSPTNYTIKAQYLKSWVIEGSVDGRTWIEMDRRCDNEDFRGGWSASIATFTAKKGPEFRFIRLTQTDRNYYGARCHTLPLTAVEFFGTLSE